jgi:flavin-binding protein dodecin
MMSVKACMKDSGFDKMIELIIRSESKVYGANRKEKIMAKQAGSAESIYKIVEVIGTSTKSWDDAAKNAVETAAGTLRDLRVAEIVKLDMKVEDGKVRAYRARVALSFKYES